MAVKCLWAKILSYLFAHPILTLPSPTDRITVQYKLASNTLVGHRLCPGTFNI